MLTHKELATAIETKEVSKSQVDQFLGKNVRCPSLVPGTMYIVKEWSVKHHCNYDNPFQVVKFIGFGHEVNGVRTLVAEIPQIKNMKDGDHFYFEGFDQTKNETFEFGAYMHNDCVCITSSAVRITCYSIGTEGDSGPVTPRKAPTARIAQPERVTVLDYIEDDGLGLPGAMICDPISMRPLRSARV